MARKGMTGPDVKAIQEGLNVADQQHSLDPDGKFGNETDKAVRRFQTANNLEPDGIVGPLTRAALFPLVATTINVVGTRVQGDTPIETSARPLLAFGVGGGAAAAPAAALPVRSNLVGFGLPLPIPIPIQPRFFTDELLKFPGLADPVPTPKVATGGRIVVDWQQFTQTQRQFDKLFTNPQDTFGLGFQTVFKRKLVNPNAPHLEIATGILLQSPIGLTDAHGNPITIAVFANATWVESLGRAGIFQWAPYAQLQGQGNSGGPVNATGQIGLFPLNLNVDLSRFDLDGITFNAGLGVVGSGVFTPTGLKTTWGPQAGVGLVGKIWFLGN